MDVSWGAEEIKAALGWYVEKMGLSVGLPSSHWRQRITLFQVVIPRNQQGLAGGKRADDTVFCLHRDDVDWKWHHHSTPSRAML